MLVYNGLCTKVLATFICEDLVDGTAILSANPVVRCWVGWHLLLVVESAALILVYIVAIPVGFAMLLYRGRRLDKLKDPEWLESCSPLPSTKHYCHTTFCECSHAQAMIEVSLPLQ